jgi:hypothetical protein
MIGGQLQYIVAQERVAELHREAEAARLATRPAAAERPKSRGSNPIRGLTTQLGRLTARLAGSKP